MGLAEMNSRLIRSPACTSPWPYAVPAATIVRASSPWAAVSSRDVEEARACDVDGGDAVDAGQPGSEQLGDRPRRASGRLGELKRDVGGVVAVLALLGTLDGDLGGYVLRGQREVSRVDRRADARRHGLGERCGIHRTRLPAARAAQRR